MSTGKFQGEVALVTGASTGIGKAAALDFAKEGAKVVLVARSEDKLKLVADEITAAGGEALAVVGDCSKEEDCKNMVDMAVSTFGALNIAFNNHGVYLASSLTDVTAEMASSVLDINLKSLIFCFKYELPAIARSGKKGSIVVNSSVMGQKASARFPTSGIYAASKAGADMLVRHAAIEGAEHNVRVNGVSPGHVFTPLYGGISIESLNEVTKTDQLIERALQPGEVSKFVMFLASDEASGVTGSIHLVDGGYSVKG